MCFFRKKSKAMPKSLISIAVDGPSGAGKSTLAKDIARRLGIHYVDTGAIYRTVGYAARERGVNPDDKAAVAAMLPAIRVDVSFDGDRQITCLDGRDLGDRIRENEISAYASKVSAVPEVRAFLLGAQRRIARENSVIMDGRDIGTVILPDADVKIFLSASAEQRAARRYKELRERGQDVDFDTLLAEIRERDERDSSRDIAPLRPADDAVLLDNSALGIEASTEAALEIIYAKLPHLRGVKNAE